MHVIKPKEMAQRLGVHPSTLQRWDAKGLLKAYRTPTNRKFYTEEQLQQYLQRAAQQQHGA